MEAGMENTNNKKDMIENLCANTWRELYGFIYYRVQNREEAEDITQETYAKAISYLNRKDVKIQESRSYLKAISLNIIRDRWKVKKRRGVSIPLEDVKSEEMIQEDFTGSLTDRDQINEAMNKLTKDQQLVLELRIIKGYSVKETARLMQRKDGSVRVLQFRALKALTELLEADNNIK
jgi:RNA polymerase sigma-70 factor, ECF subfamily